MRLVTTCNAQQFDKYGYRLLESWKHWPRDAELWWYTEGFSFQDTPGIVQVSTEKLQGLQAFKAKHANYLAPGFAFDVVRFSHKVYATVDALSDYKGVGVWIDADCVTLKDIPNGYIEGKLERSYLALFKRRGMYSETGFWIVDCSHEQHQSFMSAWVDWYDSGTFKALSNWTDCETLDATIRKFEKNQLIKSVNLSGEFDKEMHPMSKTELGTYIMHLKGNLKDVGTIPEGYQGVSI